MTVQEIAGPKCKDIIVCPQLKDPEEDMPDPDNLSLECALLVLEAIEEAGEVFTLQQQ